MQFRDWFYLEMGGIKDIDTSQVALAPKHGEFNYYNARDICKRKAEEEIYKDIPKKPEDDPEFKAQNPLAWLKDHPEPDYYSPEYRPWSDEYQKISDDYSEEKEQWDAKIHAKKMAVREDLLSLTDKCVEQAEKDHAANPPIKGYSYEFNIGSNGYTVSLDKMDGHSALSNYIGNVPGMYNIEFRGPQGYSLTRQEGGGATKIYGQLIAAVKKLVESQEVNGLYFTPAEDAMALMYRKFFEQYLSHEFVQVSSSHYLRRSWLKEKLASLPENMRQGILQKIMSGNRSMRKELENINKQKMERRNQMVTAKKYVGKIAGYYQGIRYLPIYVIRVRETKYDGVSVECYWLDNYMGRSNLQRGYLNVASDSPNMATRLADASAVPPDSLAKFQELLKGVQV